MPSHTRSRVLYVDDDLDACEMLNALLTLCQIDVACAKSAAEAWPKIQSERFDLFILDGWLPELDGYEFCRKIREGDSRTPILFYSGAAYDTDKDKAFAAGASAFVSKPDVEGLIETMLDLIAKAKAADVAPPWGSNHRRSAEQWFSPLSSRLKTATG